VVPWRRGAQRGRDTGETVEHGTNVSIVGELACVRGARHILAGLCSGCGGCRSGTIVPMISARRPATAALAARRVPATRRSPAASAGCWSGAALPGRALAADARDWMLGRNPWGRSFVAGLGPGAPEQIHHWAVADGPTRLLLARWSVDPPHSRSCASSACASGKDPSTVPPAFTRIVWPATSPASSHSTYAASRVLLFARSRRRRRRSGRRPAGIQQSRDDQMSISEELGMRS
jgi:Glycosyl hydrolase family 9